MTSQVVRPRVLLVDDYRDARDMYGQYLEYSGYQVSQAANGVELRERWEESGAGVRRRRGGSRRQPFVGRECQARAGRRRRGRRWSP